MRPGSIRGRLGPLIAISLAAGCLAPAAAGGDTLQISVQTTSPEQGIPVGLQFSGSGIALSNKSGPY
jgi:hypothetical protein